ncbi:MAG: hypothetical protein A2600_08770 [Candidatus Lambdaproteobacteria bacterium RIFOXYD1_FULL_56_27]|uniref:Cytochrome c domain-containing protein n=1 Tax=Candidatus Lambdaproteobacteria bacterium RIFOXYD2_FULL_56_26 TaxID=1817773 RepID=A0A1F6GZ73_9PROT|nr:MAG: hypothetical protein A2426_10190 [Candidatus Lambdaproteobacteria bacterium RIFOXYC1_FULL_56_13]OGH03372.1 MAG: hypothetical protein A2557_02495 [Candidatus Lambdaproteobacteria bacterium RIFOXYD2_FULL_56_26]OGH06623.1 MAG: hypothetical protein A2600_08770 [Candidatus Lambdaproteobacteria bacterium RIFOXYD1_FULL_56_27]
MKRFVIALALVAFSTGSALALDGKALYGEKKCAMCHGPEGKSAAKTFPSLAGKDAAFLAAETKKIKSGERAGAMTGAMKINPGVKNSTDEEITAIAEYLAAVK